MKMYAIKNCDTVKKARKWLEEQGSDCEFHDYKVLGADKAVLEKACRLYGWEIVLNRRGTTWRKLSEAEQAAIVDDASAIALMLEQPAIIKRPILDTGRCVLVGFKAESYAEALQELES